MHTRNFRISALLCSALVAALACAAILLSSPRPVHSQSGTQITGYAWSDTTGWISMSGSNYGLAIDSSGNVTGYAWSDNIGWISANSSDLSGCPSGSCTAKISGGNLTGWLRALSGESSGAGGWDGWISLSGSSPTYGVTLNETTGAFSGYAWGSTVVGWVDWEYASTGFTEVPPCQNTQGNFCQGNAIYSRNAQCGTAYVSTCSYECSAGSCVAPPNPTGGFSGGTAIQVDPSIVPSGTATTVSWNVQNVTSCTVAGNNADGTAQSTDTSSPGVWSGTSGTETSSDITKQTVYTVSCTALPGGSPFTQSATVNIIPVFREI